MSDAPAIIASTTQAVSVMRTTVERIHAQLLHQSEVVGQLTARVERSRGSEALSAEIAAIEAALSTSAPLALAGLDDAQARAERLTAEVAGLLAGVDRDVEAFRSIVRHHDAEVSGQHERGTDALGALRDHATEMSGSLDSGVVSLEEALTQSSQGIAASLARLEEGADALHTGLDAYQGAVDEQLEALAGHVSDLAQHAEEQTDGLEHVVEESRAHAVSHVQHDAHDVPMQALIEAAKELRSVLAHVGARTEAGGSTFSAGASGVVQQMEAVVALIEPIKPALELVARTLG